jgi:DNA-binding NtrC family response regulator
MMTLNESNLADDLSGLRVLVVEDSWDVATGLTGFLKGWGVEVLGPIATTADALRLMSERTADAAIVDINLRGGELAYELIDRLHDQGIRIFVISGYADVLVAKEKVAAVMQKPMKADVLLQNLRSARNK